MEIKQAINETLDEVKGVLPKFNIINVANNIILVLLGAVTLISLVFGVVGIILSLLVWIGEGSLEPLVYDGYTPSLSFVLLLVSLLFGFMSRVYEKFIS